VYRLDIELSRPDQFSLAIPPW